MSRAVKAFILFATIAVIAAACGGTTSSPETTESLPGSAETTSSTVVDTTTSTTTTTAPATGERLSDYIPGFFDVSDPSASEAEFRRQEQQIQEAVARCMAAEGFEYIPYIPGDDLFFGFGDPAEFASTYGYGVSTFVTMEDAFFGSPDDDPNTPILDAMSAAEQEEYFALLYGESPDFDFENMTDEEIDAAFAGFVPTGCFADAQEAIYGSLDFYVEFGEALDDLFSRVEADPRIIAAEADWSTCMSGKGYTFASQNEIYEYLQTRVDAVVTYPDPFADTDIVEPDFASMTEEEIAQFFEEQDALFAPQYDEAELAELNAEEIAIALADNSCNENASSIYDAVVAEYEAEWIAENRDALLAYRRDS